MDYEDKVKYAILNGLTMHFQISAIDVVIMSMKYQQALHGVDRIFNILSDEQKGALFLEFDGVNLHHDKISEIQEKIDMLKKHEFANNDAIKAEQKKLHIATADISKAVFMLVPNLVNMLNEFCAEHVQITMSEKDDEKHS